MRVECSTAVAVNHHKSSPVMKLFKSAPNMAPPGPTAKSGGIALALAATGPSAAPPSHSRESDSDRSGMGEGRPPTPPAAPVAPAPMPAPVSMDLTTKGPGELATSQPSCAPEGQDDPTEEFHAIR